MGRTTRRVLRGVRAFSAASNAELDELEALIDRRAVPAGELLIRQGQAVCDVHAILDGRVVVSSPDGQIATLESGEVIGALWALGGERTDVLVEAAVPTDLAVLSQDDAFRALHLPTVGPRLREVAIARAEATPGLLPPSPGRDQWPSLEPPRLRDRPVRLAIVSVLLLALVGGGGYLGANWNRTSVVTAEDLLAEFAADSPSEATSNSGEATSADDDTSVVPDPAAPGATTDEVNASPEVGPTDAASPIDGLGEEGAAGAQGDPSDPADAPAPATSDPTGMQPPDEGVWSYRTTGGEQLNVPGARHQYPENTFAAVRHQGECAWVFDHRVLEEHRDQIGLCSRDQTLLGQSVAIEITFFGQTDRFDFICDPPPVMMHLTATEQRTGGCETADGDAAVSYVGTTLGDDTRDIGGQAVATRRMQLDFTFTGRARGTAQWIAWLDASTGMIVRIERTSDLDVDAVFGSVSYTEDATHELLSMTPQR